MRYSVGHHTNDLITLLVLTWQEAHDGQLPRTELLTAAAFHDIPERVTGDIMGNIKDLLNGAMDEVEAKVLDWLGTGVSLTDEEARWLKVCDQVELYLWCIEEAYARGVPYFNQWVKEYDAYFFENPTPHTVFDDIMGMAKIMKGTRLTNAELNEIAGL